MLYFFTFFSGLCFFLLPAEEKLLSATLSNFRDDLSFEISVFLFGSINFFAEIVNCFIASCEVIDIKFDCGCNVLSVHTTGVLGVFSLAPGSSIFLINTNV